MNIIKKFLSQFRDWRNHNKKVYPLLEPFHGNMYDFFMKKTIDRPLDKKDTQKYDDGRINWSSTDEGPKIRRFVIPVGGLSREEAERQIQELMREYHEDVEWHGDGGLDTFQSEPKTYNRIYSDIDPYGEENWDDNDIHELHSNTKIPPQKDFWFPTRKQKSLMEQARMIYSKNNAAIYKKFVIPVGNWEPVLE